MWCHHSGSLLSDAHPPGPFRHMLHDACMTCKLAFQPLSCPATGVCSLSPGVIDGCHRVSGALSPRRARAVDARAWRCGKHTTSAVGLLSNATEARLNVVADAVVANVQRCLSLVPAS